MKKLARYLLLLAAMGLGFAFASCKTDDDDEPTYYTVSFNSNGGTEVKSQSIESGNKATKPANPIKQAIATETYAFENWYTSTDNGTTLSDTAFDFNTPITKDITLYAKWATNVVTHTVTFDSKNGSTAEIKTVNHGNTVERPTNPTKAATESETYAFDNWYTSTDGGATLSDTAFDFNTPITKDITLYAKWSTNVVTHTVTFDSKNGSTAEIKAVNHGNKVERPTNPTKAATEAETYAFDNWYTSTDGGTTLSDTAFDFNTPITKDITLYAKWSTYVVTHTVTFDSKNGSTAEIKTVNHGNKVERPTNPTKAATEAETYAFDNWYTSTDGGTTLS
ncbi:MAG: InlB B-repeat-containing protein, partial [Treponema sp.]|nr:InlB B-repeat-containing protein [Treponema sp.]